VSSVASWSEKGLGDNIKLSILNSGSKGMFRVVAMLLGSMAREAEIVIVTGCARNEVLLG
jgi:hypothetical protein